MSAKGEDIIAGLNVPEFHGPVEARRGDSAEVGAENDGGDVGRVPGQGVNDSAARLFDDLERVMLLTPRSDDPKAGTHPFLRMPHDEFAIGARQWRLLGDRRGDEPGG